MKRIYNINRIKGAIGTSVCQQLLFIHAFSGCDSTSRIFGVGKRSLFEKLMKGDPVIEVCAEHFLKPNQPSQVIERAGELAMVSIMGGERDQSLTQFRVEVFLKKLKSAKHFVTPEKLPPTSSSTKFHSLRTYFQSMTWLGKEDELDVVEWGWKNVNNKLIPSMTEIKVAPDHLLKLVHCNCTTGCRTTRCSCRRYGIPCQDFCGQCQVSECQNTEPIQEED